MSKFQRMVGLALVAVLAFAGIAEAQGIPTARLSGRVTDADGNGVPGVTVEVSSAALQGVRSTQTDVNGDYIVPSLPAGEQRTAPFGEFSLRWRRDGAEIVIERELVWKQPRIDPADYGAFRQFVDAVQKADAQLLVVQPEEVR